ncbi:MAG: type II toxin-antitoxin system VapC family toxin [Terriglobales bacterium]
MTVLVDSDVLIEVSRERNHDILSRWTQLAESGSAILCSPVSSAELWAGALPREHEATAKLFRTLVCVPIDYETGRRAGDYLRQYGKSHGLQITDALIAAAAVLNRAELWTRNRKHYPMKELSFY